MSLKLSRRTVVLVVLLTAVAVRGNEGWDPTNPTTAPANRDVPFGWASVDGGTTGGQGGATVTASDVASLVRFARSREPLTIRLSGTFRLSRPLDVGSNKTLVGVGPGATITGGGLRLDGVSNVIIRNIAIAKGLDAISIDRGSRHVWVDHCDLSQCRDGLIDIKRASDLVTVSWSRFHDHGKTSLVGHSDKEADLQVDRGRLRVTYHHNFFDGTGTRHPRVRVAESVHVFNNYYFKAERGVNSVMDAGVLVEGNYFEGVKNPTDTAFGASPQPGRLVERDNVYAGSGRPSARGTVREPRDFYRYTLDDPREVPALVRGGAGVGKVGRWPGPGRTSNVEPGSQDEEQQ